MTRTCCNCGAEAENRQDVNGWTEAPRGWLVRDELFACSLSCAAAVDEKRDPRAAWAGVDKDAVRSIAERLWKKISDDLSGANDPKEPPKTFVGLEPRYPDLRSALDKPNPIMADLANEFVIQLVESEVAMVRPGLEFAMRCGDCGAVFRVGSSIPEGPVICPSGHTVAHRVQIKPPST